MGNAAWTFKLGHNCGECSSRTESIRRADVEAVGGPVSEALIPPEAIAFSTSNSPLFLCAEDMKLAGDIQNEDTEETEE